MDTTRCDKVIQFALLEAGRNDDYTERDLGPIHLLKYAYLADLEHAERGNGEGYTGARWTFYHFGPWAQEVYKRIEPALAAIDADRRTISSAKFDDDFVRWQRVDDELYEQLARELPSAVVSSVRRNVRKFGKDTGELLNFVYTTRPMRRAVPNVELVLTVAERTEGGHSSAKSGAPTARQVKKEQERLAALKAEFKARFAARRAERASRKAVVEPPVYDEVYFEGLRWLDSLGTGGASEFEAEAVFDDEVWTSDTRGEERD